MSKNQTRPPFDPIRAVKKLFLSASVIVMFAAYVAIDHLTRSDGALAQAAPTTPTPLVSGPSGPIGFPGDSPTAVPSQPIPATSASSQQTGTGYKNGTYQGPAVDAYYGLVQVQVTIQNGSIQNVQFLQYPSDRRTSQEINAQAMPWLQQEAIQAQSANVQIISGATLTSEGFQMSLQSALQSAHN